MVFYLIVFNLSRRHKTVIRWHAVSDNGVEILLQYDKSSYMIVGIIII